MSLQKSTGKPRLRGKSTLKRAQIVDAAGSLFVSDGFEATSMEAVAKAADVSKQTIYSHFGSKEEVFVAAIESRLDAYHLVPTATDLDLSPREFLPRLARRFSELVSSAEVIAMYRVLIAEGARQPQIVALFWEKGPMKTKALLASYLDAQVLTGRLQIDDTTRASKQFFHMLQGELFMSLLLGLDPAEALRQQADYIDACLEMFFARYEPPG